MSSRCSLILLEVLKADDVHVDSVDVSDDSFWIALFEFKARYVGQNVDSQWRCANPQHLSFLQEFFGATCSASNPNSVSAVEIRAAFFRLTAIQISMSPVERGYP